MKRRRPLVKTPDLPRRYVVVIDESDPRPALDWAVSWARIRSAEIVLGGSPEDLVFTRTYVAEITAEATAAQQEHPSLEISAAADGAVDLRSDDLLVVGVAWARDDPTRMRAARLAGLAPCSVLVVPPAKHPAGVGVVAAINSLDLARPAVRFAAAEAELRRQPLTLLHVRESASRLTRSDIRELQSLVATEFPTVHVTVQTTTGVPAAEICAVAREAELLVTGSERVPSPETTLGQIIRMTPVATVIAKAGFAPA